MAIPEEIATMQIYQGGITIHSAMDMRIQKIAESIYTDPEYQPSDEEILSGFYMMDYSDGSWQPSVLLKKRKATACSAMQSTPQGSRLCYQTGFYLCARH